MITLYSADNRIIKAVRDITSPKHVKTIPPNVKKQPKADAVVTFGGIDRETAFLAARSGTGLIYVLPEATDALHEAIHNDKVATLIGSDAKRFNRLSF